MGGEKLEFTLTVNQLLAVTTLLLAVVVALFGAAGWVVSRIDRLEEGLGTQIRTMDARVDELAEDTAFIRGQLGEQ